MAAIQTEGDLARIRARLEGMYELREDLQRQIAHWEAVIEARLAPRLVLADPDPR